jgi:hypothetical protein
MEDISRMIELQKERDEELRDQSWEREFEGCRKLKFVQNQHRCVRRTWQQLDRKLRVKDVSQLELLHRRLSLAVAAQRCEAECALKTED